MQITDRERGITMNNWILVIDDDIMNLKTASRILSDEKMRVSCLKSGEEAIEFLADDELLEVTPESLRIRKVILDQQARAKAKFAAKQGLKS